MTDEAPSKELTTQQRAAIGKTKAGGVSGRLKAALDDMTWNGTPWEEAARKANLTVRAMRLALKRPQVLKYLRTERGVLLAQSSPKTFHRLAELRDQDENRNAAVAAARTLEAMTNETFGGGSVLSVSNRGSAGYVIDLAEPDRPGLQIVIHAPPQPAEKDDPQMIDVTPNQSSDDDRH
ncbi:hypothetical protein RAD16_05160 [Bradyrhizobium sp. 18BD]